MVWVTSVFCDVQNESSNKILHCVSDLEDGSGIIVMLLVHFTSLKMHTEKNKIKNKKSFYVFRSAVPSLI